jgi:hypothetical protein
MAIQLLAAAGEQGPELPMSAGAFGIVALAVFAALLAVTWAFRSVGKRH